MLSRDAIGLAGNASRTVPLLEARILVTRASAIGKRATAQRHTAVLPTRSIRAPFHSAATSYATAVCKVSGIRKHES